MNNLVVLKIPQELRIKLGLDFGRKRNLITEEFINQNREEIIDALKTSDYDAKKAKLVRFARVRFSYSEKTVNAKIWQAIVKKYYSI